ncbi:hypothetical protein TSUD_390780 [Trifolium subterraneum]|uniref:Transposase-associated domain-containing protein n=1 Tax=Trifolium subterraneum TaxID=3900 RepID=A0A2Z6MZ19_TRISU|nr:hypothetical protein TSUD_390780 [Trifolium subterraneum]
MGSYWCLVRCFPIQELLLKKNGYPPDRSWVYDRLNPRRGGLKPAFISGVKEFVRKAKRRPQFVSDGGIRCPCDNCTCRRIQSVCRVKLHLYKEELRQAEINRQNEVQQSEQRAAEFERKLIALTKSVAAMQASAEASRHRRRHPDYDEDESEDGSDDGSEDDDNGEN